MPFLPARSTKIIILEEIAPSALVSLALLHIVYTCPEFNRKKSVQDIQRDYTRLNTEKKAEKEPQDMEFYSYRISSGKLNSPAE